MEGIFYKYLAYYWIVLRDFPCPVTEGPLKFQDDMTDWIKVHMLVMLERFPVELLFLAHIAIPFFLFVSFFSIAYNVEYVLCYGTEN